MNNNLINGNKNFEPIFKEIRNLIVSSRNKVYSVVNTEMLSLYWKSNNGNTKR